MRDLEWDRLLGRDGILGGGGCPSELAHACRAFNSSSFVRGSNCVRISLLAWTSVSSALLSPDALKMDGAAAVMDAGSGVRAGLNSSFNCSSDHGF